MPALTNPEIIQAFAERDAINAELSELSAQIAELQAQRAVLERRHEAASNTTEIYNGVALSIFEHHVSAVDYQVGKWATVYEHARRPGSFLVQAHTRHRNYVVLPETYASFEAAQVAAKDFVTL